MNKNIFIKAVVASAFVLAFVFGAYGIASAANCQSGLVGYWKLDGNAQDSSGNGNNGTPNGMSFVTGKIGQAGSFAGNASSYANVYNSSSLNPSQITVAAWINPSSNPTIASIVKKSDFNQQNGYTLEGASAATTASGNNQYRFGVYISPEACPGNNALGIPAGWCITGITPQLQIGTWNYLVGTYDGSNLRLYLNGSLVTAIPASGGIKSSINQLMFGKDPSNPNDSNRFFHGLIDEVSIYNRALNASEVLSNYNFGVGRDICPSPNITCASNSECGANGFTGSPFCQNNNVYQNYITYTCSNPGTANSSCSNSTSAQLKSNCTGNQTCSNGSCGSSCTYHSYQQCSGNNLYWFDSCGTQQDLIQYCQNGCQNNSCSYNPYGNCTYHAYKLCQGNDIYWYDSCGTRQELYQSCYGVNQTCQYGLCTAIQYPPAPNPYVLHYRTACYADNLYWYDSLGSASGLYRSCSDNNSCTTDTCSSSKCSNVLIPNCPAGNCGNGLCETSLGETSANCVSDCKIGENTLSMTFLAKKDVLENQWNKTIQVGSNGNAYFLITVTNNSDSQADNVNVSANLPNEIGYLGNLKVNDISVAGDIVSGINAGSLAARTTKVITFEGKTQALNTEASKQGTASITSGGATQSDTVTINLTPSQAAAISSAPPASGFWEFLKRWYLWILVILVLIFLFIVIFRRLSSNA